MTPVLYLNKPPDMLLTFSKDSFVYDIQSGNKIHTIRHDKSDRWHAGRKIHFWRGNPRNVKANPYQFDEGVCSSVQRIAIRWYADEEGTKEPYVWIDGKILGVGFDANNNRELALKDGFTSTYEFFEWFNEDFDGKVIHWTDFKYQN